MAKKVILGTLLFGLIGILLVGAVIRTLDKTGNIAEAQGHGNGRSAGRAVEATNDGYATQPGEVIATGRGQWGGGYARSADAASAPAAETIAPEEWVTVEGTVVQEPAAGVDLIVETPAGEQIVIGTGPGYLDTQGFALQAGELVRVQGFWEDGEFKAGELARLRDGATLQLRDAYGRPAWSGAYGRGASTGVGGQTTYGYGNRGQAAAGAAAVAAGGTQGGYGGAGNAVAPGDGSGTGQAEVGEWVTLEGTAIAVSADEMTFQAASGETVLVDGRAWRFIQEQGFTIGAGDTLRLTGFYENGDLEVGAIDDLSTGLSVSIRDENGRPLWAGRGGRSS